MIQDPVHGDPCVALLINAFSIADQQYLGRFMVDPEGFGDLIGDGTVAEQVQEIEIDGCGELRSFEPVLHQLTGGATGTMFEDHLGAIRRSFADLFELCLCV